MSLSTMLHVVAGFRVKYDEIWEDGITFEDRCKHNFDRQSMIYCPECGKESKPHEYWTRDLLVGMAEDEVEGHVTRDGIILTYMLTNCDERDFKDQSMRDYVIGEVLCYIDSPYNNIMEKLKNVNEQDILERAKTAWPKIIFEEDSFGIYVIQSCW